VTNDDENNIMSCLLAKRMGARRVVALINRRSYVDLLQAGESISRFHPRRRPSARCSRTCGAAMSPRCTACGAAWRKRLEAVVHGNRDSCRCVGRKIEEIDLPKGAAIAAIVRGTR